MVQLKLPSETVHLLGIPETTVQYPGASSLDTPNGRVWVKTNEKPKRDIYRKALAALGYSLPLPILRPSKAGKGGDSLLRQAEQIAILDAADLPVPKVRYCDRDFLILTDAGIALDAAVKDETTRRRLALTEEDLHIALMTMTDTLATLHAKGFAHGRPKIRDFGWRDGVATLLDLEERPWEVMPMPAAQARDIFLWIMDLSVHPASRSIAPQAMARFKVTMSEATADELQTLLRLLTIAAPVARVVDKLHPDKRDIVGALAGYEVMKAALRP